MSTGRTTIIVTRRLSSIKMVNKIIVLNKGRVEEEGSHTQLMDKHGTYFNLYTKQQKFFKSSEKDLTLDSISEIPEAYEGSEDTEKVVGGATAGIMDPPPARTCSCPQLMSSEKLLTINQKLSGGAYYVYLLPIVFMSALFYL